jgi:hypothetical protein
MRRLIFTGWLCIPLLTWLVCLGHIEIQEFNPDSEPVTSYFKRPVNVGCDYLDACRCPVDLQQFNPLYPWSLHYLLYHEVCR